LFAKIITISNPNPNPYKNDHYITFNEFKEKIAAQANSLFPTPLGNEYDLFSVFFTCRVNGAKLT
jgi:hypothetical protein